METLLLHLEDVLPRLDRSLELRGVGLFDIARCTPGVSVHGFEGAVVALEVVVARGDAPTTRLRVELEHAHGHLLRATCGAHSAKSNGALEAVVDVILLTLQSIA